MPPSLAAYRAELGRIHGAFTIDAALLFCAYGALLAEAGVRGSVLEIGAHQGLSAIAVAQLRAPGARFVAVDTFGLPRADAAASGAMSGDEKALRANLARWGVDERDLRVIARDSRDLVPADIGEGFAFCHVDGGHSAEETYHDLSLAAGVSVEGGLVAVDDHFNPSFPGVSEGSLRYLAEHPGELVPLAIGANKVLYQRAPERGGLGAALRQRYAYLPATSAVFGGREVPLFGSGLEPFVDLERSTFAKLVPREVSLRADIEVRRPRLAARRGEAVALEVRVRNRGSVPFAWSDAPFGLSYHLEGSVPRYENPRVWFDPPLRPGEERDMVLTIDAPDVAGEHDVIVDVVWEGHCWLRDRGNEPGRARLRVA